MSGFLWPNGSATPPRLGSAFGPRPSFNTPGGATNPFHYGQDMTGFVDNCSIADGTVTFVGYNGGYGNFVRVDHGGGIESSYAHGAPNGFYVSRGQRVTAGQRLHRQGTTGRSTGVHLHLEVYRNGVATDPVAFIHSQARPAGGASTTPEGFLMALSDPRQEDIAAKIDLITRIIADPKPRQGGKMGGTVTLEGLIQWYDHNMLELREVTQAQHDVTRGFVVGQAQAMHDVTRRYLADSITAAVARVSPGVTIDEVRAAVAEAVANLPEPVLSDEHAADIARQLTAASVAGIDAALKDDFEGVKARIAQLPAETIAALKSAL